MAELEFEPEVIIPPQGAPKAHQDPGSAGLLRALWTLQNAPLGNPAFLLVLGSLRPRRQSFADLGSGLVCSHMGVEKLNPSELDLVAVPTGTDFGGKGKGLGGSSP